MMTLVIKTGSDAYKLASFIDPSGAWTRSSALNEFGPVRGLNVETNVQINWDGFIHSRTKSEIIKKFKPKYYRSVLPGTGRIEKKPKLTNESIIYARQIAKETFQQVWRKDYLKNREKLNYTVLTAIKAIKQRNYHGRFDAEIKKFFSLNLTCSNKDQFKPIKNHKLDLLKGGQALLQSPARINLQFIGWMRGQGFLFKDAMQDDYFTDDYETPAQFRLRMYQAIEKLPNSVRVAIADGEQWDSQQNPVTLEIEKEMTRLFGATDETIKQYFYVRGNLNFVMHGMFKGTTNGEKGSGFLDTKCGNTKLAVVFGNRIITGVGPKVVGVKGDDYAKLQTGLKINEHEAKIQEMSLWVHFPTPRNADEVRSFLGTAGYYRRFIDRYANIAVPLTNMLKKNKTFQWGNSEEKAFRILQQRLIHAPVLTYPDRQQIQILTTDASNHGISAILSQSPDVQPKRRHYLMGRYFKLRTDNAALTYIMSPKKPSPKLSRWAACLMEYDYDILHLPGVQNPADSLSRLFPVQQIKHTT
ncbi:hypothetical protein G6F37_011298 [Rhizopus arrhizus]|nr:hypothetical protein G6F38_011036 [Rhizopus arrhizus]KAG1149998.1 hypothetical protein G6F37_011298 [Rhizopus arrhizus]